MHKLILHIAAYGGVLLGTCAAAAPGQEEALSAVPSGLEVVLLDQFIEAQPNGAHWARFRFVAAALAGGVGHARIEDDFAYLCTNYALPQLQAEAQKVAQVVISLSSEALEFGATDSDVIQYFEAFGIESGRCIWEGF